MRFNEHTCGASPPVQSMDDVASKSPDIPLSRQEDKLATSLVRRKLAQVSEDGMVHFKTGGQVLIHRMITLMYPP